MIRNVSRIAARVARSRVATVRTQSVRAFATGSQLTPAGAAPAPANLRTVKHELARMLDEDASELAAQPDEGLVNYIKEQKLKIVADKEGEIKLTRSIGDYQITVTFTADADEMDPMDAAQSEQQPAGEGEGETTMEGQEGSEDYELPAHSFEVDIANVNAKHPTSIRLQASASKQGELVIDSVLLDPQARDEKSTPEQMSEFDVNDANRLDLADLSEGGQEKILELLESLGVDDKMAQFVQHYSQVVRTQQYLDKIRKLKAFLTA